MAYPRRLSRNGTVGDALSPVGRMYCGTQGFDMLGETFNLFFPRPTGLKVSRFQLTQTRVDDLKGMIKVFGCG